jgi:carboxypeptidase PM20D1
VLEAANALAATGFKPERTILIAVAHDGETRGAKGAKALATTLAARGTRAWFAVDQGLGVVARAPLTDKPAALIGVVEKPEGVLRVAASAKGSGVGGRGKAVAELAEALIVLRAAAPHVSVDDPITLGTIKALTADLSPVRAFLLANAWACEPILNMQDDLDTQAMLSTTAAPLRLAEGPSGGADEAQAFVSIRLHPTDSANAFVNRARKALTPYPSIVVAWEDPPPPVARPARSNSDSYLLLASVARRATGAPPAPSLYVLSSTGRFFEGVAKDVYRFTPAYWMPRQLDSLSGADAYLPVTEYQRMIGFYAQLMAEASR